MAEQIERPFRVLLRPGNKVSDGVHMDATSPILLNDPCTVATPAIAIITKTQWRVQRGMRRCITHWKTVIFVPEKYRQSLAYLIFLLVVWASVYSNKYCTTFGKLLQ